MKAAILEEFHQPLVVEEVELLPPAPDGAIVRTTASAFCITDCMNQRGELGKKLPTILGHAGFGVVEEVGAEVTRARPGDRVVVPGTPECGVCYWCERGRPDQCAALVVPQPHVANRANGEQVTSSGGGGTYAEKMRVPESWLFPVETELPTTSSPCSAAGSRPASAPRSTRPGSSPARPWRSSAAAISASGWCRARGSRTRARSSPSSRSRSGGGWPASSAPPISWTRRPATRRAGSRADRRSRRRLRARGCRPRRRPGAGVPDEPPGRHGRPDRARRLRDDGDALPARPRDPRQDRPQLPERQVSA